MSIIQNEHHLTFNSRMNLRLWMFKQRFCYIEMLNSISHFELYRMSTGIPLITLLVLKNVLYSPSDMCTKTTESGEIEYKYEPFHNVRPLSVNKFQIWGHAKKSISLPWRLYLFRHYRISYFWPYLYN